MTVGQTVSAVIAKIAPSSPPVRLLDLLVEVADAGSDLERLEWAEALLPRVTVRLRRLVQEERDSGRDTDFVFNASDDRFIQGSCFIEPCDSDSLRDAKQRRVKSQVIASQLRSLAFDEFELLCCKVLELVGAHLVRKTRRTRDQGIDFYARLSLGDLSSDVFPFRRFQDSLHIWILGQAKHYPGGRVSSAEIRELLGSVHLARAKEFASGTGSFNDLAARSCDPLMALFVTSGEFSRDARSLAQRSGIVVKDLVDLSTLLADKRAVGEDRALVDWLTGRFGNGNPAGSWM
jgi:hypothetical protein